MSVPHPLPRLVVFGDDWGRHPSSSQHLVTRLLPRYRVDWVETVGTRRPKLAAADLARGLEKLRSWSSRASRDAPLPENLRVHSPVHWPGFKTRLERGLNRRLLARALAPVLDAGDPPTAVVTAAPIVADLAARKPHLPWVYYCVDDLSEWPGLDGGALRAMEAVLVPCVKRIVVVSEALRERMRALGRESVLLTHGIDLEHWRGVAERHTAHEPPVALYFGHADRRLDTPILLALARTLRVRITGPVGTIDPALRDAPIEWTGPIPYGELPARAAAADVLVMPYADLPVTRAMQPLKLKEYLATGLPVVATPLPANRAWADAMDLTWEPESFARTALERARSGVPAAQRSARERLAGESWEEKARAFERELLLAATEASA